MMGQSPSGQSGRIPWFSRRANQHQRSQGQEAGENLQAPNETSTGPPLAGGGNNRSPDTYSSFLSNQQTDEGLMSFRPFGLVRKSELTCAESWQF